MNKRAFVVGILTLVVCAATVYFHSVVGTDIIFPHLYYLPIILAAIGWERRSWFLTAFLCVFLLGSHVISGIEVSITSNLARAATFLLVGGVAAELSRARRQAGEALQASYRHQATILGSMLDAVVVANPDGTIRTVNRAALELLGYSEEELIGQPVGTIFEEEEEEEEEEEFFRGTGLAQLVREGAARDVEMTLLTKSGERIPVVFNGSVIQEEDGHLSAVVGVARDIRERKRAEEELRQYRDHLEELVEERTAELAKANEQLQQEIAERKRAEEELLQRQLQLSVLNRVGLALAETLELARVYRIAYEHVAEFVDCPCFGISLYDAATRTLRVEFMLSDGEALDMARFPPLSMDVEPTRGRARAIATGQPEVMRNYQAATKDVNYAVLIGAPGDERVACSALYVPLVVRGQVIGLLESQSYRLDAYGAEEVALLRPVANQIGLAIENARLYQETQQRLSELSTLFEVSGGLRGAATVGEMLPIILDKTLEVVAAEAGAIFLVDEAAQQVVVAVARGAMEEALVGRSFPLAGTLTERMLRTGETDVSLDLATDLRMPEEMRAVRRGGETGIGLPLRAADAPLGMMAVSWLAPHAVSDDEIHLLTAIANMAASAIYRAGLFEKLQNRVRELATVYEVGKAVTAILHIEDVLGLVAEVAPRALHAEGCYLFLWEEWDEQLVLQAVESYPPELVGELRYRLGEGLAGWVFLEGKVANVPDLAADPRWKREPEYEAALPSGLANNALVVPLSVRDKTLGVLGVVNKTGAPAFTKADESLLTALAGQVAIAIENARLYKDVRDLSLGAIRSLASAIDARDPYTRGHSEQVARLSVLLAQELGWQGADLEMLEFAALLHDVGKIGVPDAVLKKTEPLTRDEWNSIHLHPYHSAQIVKPVEPLQRIVPWIYHHQERWDGSGYPNGLKGERIPLASRIIAVADAFNAMTTDRPYRKAKTREEAIEELRRCAGTQFDPQVVEVFLRMQAENVKRET